MNALGTMANKAGAIPVFSEFRAFGETDRQEINGMGGNVGAVGACGVEPNSDW